METIEINNFGPIENLKIRIKEINIFIGKTSSGKSTVAKLICIFNSEEFIRNSNVNVFKKLLKNYNIDFDISQNTFIEYRKNNYYWKFEKNQLINNYPYNEIVSFINPVYEIVKNSSQNKKLSKAMFSLLLLNIVDFTSLKKINALQNKKTAKIFEIISEIVDIKDEISKGIYNNLDKIDELIISFYSVVKNEIDLYTPIYIPAERIILSMIADSVFGLLKNDVSLAQCIKDFGSQFEVARSKNKNVNIDILNATYNYENKTNFITLNDGKKLKLEQASSGFQSITPLYLVLNNLVSKNDGVTKNIVVVEEPELSLYPTIQKMLLEFIIEKVNNTKSKLIITTHSPYILTSFDNLIQANNTFIIDKTKKEKLSEIINQKLWVNFDAITSYYFDDKTANETLDYESRNIGSSKIDDVSEKIADEFEQILELKYS